MRIPPPKISFVGGQTRSLSVGLANAVTRSIHDIPVTSTPDTIAKAFGDHSSVLKSLDDLLDELGDAHLALQGSTAGMDTPIVRAIEQYIAERKQAQETYPDLRLPDLESLIDAMAQASQAADNELVLVKNKSKHRMSALRKAFALGISAVYLGFCGVLYARTALRGEHLYPAALHSGWIRYHRIPA